MSNNVRGPTSALTEFLKEQGITARSSGARRRGPVLEDETTAAGPSTSASVEADEEAAPEHSHQSSRSKKGKMNGYASDDLDEEDEFKETQPAKKRKLTKAATEKLKAKEKANARKKRGRKKGDSDEEYENSEEDEYMALSKARFTKVDRNTAPSQPSPGSFANCATCGNKFTVTRYTLSAKSVPGFLCHKCAKASGVDPFKKLPVPRKRKDPAEKRKVVSFEDTERVQSLTTMCIKVIGKYIEDIESLGDIGSFNMNELARVIAKNRSLTAENSQLFYDIKNLNLTLYDATNLRPEALCTLGSLNPNLESLRLEYCGCMDDTSLKHLSSHLTSLNRMELLGPFLVRVPAWIYFFEQRGPQLRGFLITQSPRFDFECIEALAKYAVDLMELRLAEVGKLSDSWLPKLANLSRLTSLELSRPGQILSDAAVIELLQAVGSNLTHLTLSGNEKLSDLTLLDGILAHTGRLASLAFANTPLVTDEGIAELFNSWSANPPLDMLDLSRNHLLSSTALEAVLGHSGNTLKELNINGWKGTSTEALMELGSKAPLLKRLDVGWCRGVNDFVIKGLLDGCSGLQDIKCYGCNRITEDCPRKSGVKLLGVESDTLG